MLLTKTVKYYSKEIPVSELSKNSNKKVKVKCPSCNKIRETYYKAYLKSESDKCQPCTIRDKLSKDLPIGKVYNRLTIIAPAKESGKSICKCKCGKVKVMDNYSIKSGHTKSCGCLKKENFNNTKKVSGSNHGRWKGGISGKRDRHMETAEYKNWRKSVFKRDNYTCQKCGQKGYKLNAHHIKPYNQFIELSTIVSNGATLCKDCHIDFHSQYGNKDFGKNEFNIFKNKGCLN